MKKETEWLEFKRDFQNPEDIGEYISALSNSAALHSKEAAFLIWGIGNKREQIYFYPNSSIATTGTVDWQFQVCGWDREENRKAGGILWTRETEQNK